MAAPFPPIISSLPQIDTPIEGAQGWLLQGESRQAVFLRLAPGVVVPDHTHGAQWGIVIENFDCKSITKSSCSKKDFGQRCKDFLTWVVIYRRGSFHIGDDTA